MYLPLRQLSPGGTDSHLPFGRVFGVGRETHLLPRRIAMFASNLRLRCVLGLAQRLCGFYALTAIVLAGCCHGPTVTTNSTVCADGHIINEGPTPGNSGPLHPFTVPRQDSCNGGPSVAVITVDGILLDMDMVGPSSIGENPVSLFREQLDEAAADPCTRAVVVRSTATAVVLPRATSCATSWNSLNRARGCQWWPALPARAQGARITWRLRPIKLSPCRYRLSVAWV